MPNRKRSVCPRLAPGTLAWLEGVVCCIAVVVAVQQAFAEASAPGVVAAPTPAMDNFGDPLPPHALTRLGMARLRHGGPVVAVAFAPDGRTVVSGSWDWTARIFDRGTGRELHVLRGHQGWVHAVAFSPDGELVATAGDRRDQTIRLWDPRTGKELRRLRGHQNDVFGVAFSPNGKILVSAGSDGTLRLWDPASGQLIRQLRGHGAGVHAVCFTPDSKTIISGGEDGTARLWDVSTGAERHQLPWQAGAGVNAVACSPNGKLVALPVCLSLPPITKGRSWDS